MKASSLTPRRRRSLNYSVEGQVSEILDANSPIISENHSMAPGLRVLHDVQISERDIQHVSGFSSEDCRFVLLGVLWGVYVWLNTFKMK